MDYGVLGTLRVRDESALEIDVGGRKPRLALALLLTRPNEVVSADSLIDVIWDEELPSDPPASLQVLISRLRKALGAPVLESRTNGYSLRVAPDELDSEVFDRMIRDARHLSDIGYREDALERADAALGLWRGEAFADFAYHDFAQIEASRLQEARALAAEMAVSLLTDIGRSEEALTRVKALVQQNPLREGLWATYMLSLYRLGRQADALRTFQLARTVLGDEVGIEPGPALRSLEDRILQQDPSLMVEAEVASGPPEVTRTYLVTMTNDESVLRPVASRLSELGTVFRVDQSSIWAAIDDAPAAAKIAAELIADPELGRGIRIGIHTGPSIILDGRPVGLAVQRATRIAAFAQPGQAVVSAALAHHVGDTTVRSPMRSLGVVLLPGITSPDELFELAVAAAALDDLRHRLGNLPAQLTTFVGRAQDLNELARLVGHHRLVTITGPGGIGKTRLALQVAADHVGRYRDGVWLVEFAATATTDRVSAAIASAIGIEEEPGIPSDTTLMARLENAELMLVLDNCEHMIDSIASTVAELLSCAPLVSIVATSRERLGIRGEVVWALSGLETPDPDGTPAEFVDESDAVTLFRERATLVAPGFSLDEETTSEVARLCRLLDGIPLAIELAASQADVYSPGRLVEMAEDTPISVATQDRNRTPRHATLESTIRWGWDLLEPDLQRAMRMMSIFKGSFDAAAASAVAELDESTIAPSLQTLARRSWLTVDRGAGRFGMLRSINQYANRLLAEDERAAAHAHHASHYLALAVSWERVLEGTAQLAVLADYDASLADFRSAIDWTIRNGQAADIMRFVGAMQWYWLRRGFLIEGLETSLAALEAVPTLTDDLGSRVLGRAGALAGAQFRFDLAEELLNRRLLLLDNAPAPRPSPNRVHIERAATLNNLANIALHRGQLSRAKALAEESHAVFMSDIDMAPVAVSDRCGSLSLMATIAIRAGDLTSARQFVNRSLAMANDWHVVLLQQLLGEADLEDHNVQSARSHYERSRAGAIDLNDADLLVQAVTGISKTLIYENRNSDALSELASQAEIIYEGKAGWASPEYHEIAALANTRAGQREAALENGKMAIETSTRQDRAYPLALALETTGEILQELGDQAGAEALSAAVLRFWAESGFQRPLWRPSVLGQKTFTTPANTKVVAPSLGQAAAMAMDRLSTM